MLLLAVFVRSVVVSGVIGCWVGCGSAAAA